MLYVVTNDEHLYGERVGEFICETLLHIHLRINNEVVIFNKDEVQKLY